MDIQARLYYRIIEQNIKKDPYFKDYHLNPYIFIVANRITLCPLVWVFKDTASTGTLCYGKNKQIELRDPFDIAKELNTYLEYECNTPLGIDDENPNDIVEWLNKL